MIIVLNAGNFNFLFYDKYEGIVQTPSAYRANANIRSSLPAYKCQIRVPVRSSSIGTMGVLPNGMKREHKTPL